MAYDLSQISSGVCVRAPRIILLGVEKIGKSTFAAGANRPVFLPIKGEEGIDELDVDKVPVCNTVPTTELCSASRLRSVSPSYLPTYSAGRSFMTPS